MPQLDIITKRFTIICYINVTSYTTYSNESRLWWNSRNEVHKSLCKLLQTKASSSLIDRLDYSERHYLFLIVIACYTRRTDDSQLLGIKSLKLS